MEFLSSNFKIVVSTFFLGFTTLGKDTLSKEPKLKLFCNYDIIKIKRFNMFDYILKGSILIIDSLLFIVFAFFIVGLLIYF